MKIQRTMDSGNNVILIGTHALFEETVEMEKLGLVIIDEQHRFGVLQRFKLIKKGKSPDVMVMSATPIPRTLSMTIYGDLDVSIIDEMPENRIEVKTYLRDKERLPKIYKFINDKINEGNQAFIIYPLIEESDKIDLEDAKSNFEYLKNTWFAERRVALLHGKMSWSEKEIIMEEFSGHKYDILVSTTVIEVGIDIPNANVMLINEAHRFGIAQLHQLRGRIGRGNKESHCILVTGKEYIKSHADADINLEYLSPAQIERYKTSIRLNALKKYASGFKLSEIDLKLRGPGNLFGTSQSGYPELKYTDIVNDNELLLIAKTNAFKIIEEDNFLKKEKNFLIKKTLHSNYQDNLTYSNIP
jgi:ATP-dependent DNA helicase RecG